MAIIEGGMETDERERARRPKRRGAQRPVSLFPRDLVIPAKAGTYWRRPDRSTLSRRVRGVLSPYRERGILALCAPQMGRRSRLRGNDGHGGGVDNPKRGT